MKYFINIFKTLGIMFLILFIGILLITSLSIFNVINNPAILSIVVIFSSTLIGGIMLGKISKNKGWLEGIKLSIIFNLILFIINIIFINNFSFKQILYYLIITISITVGSMIGISNKNIS